MVRIHLKSFQSCAGVTWNTFPAEIPDISRRASRSFLLHSESYAALGLSSSFDYGAKGAFAQDDSWGMVSLGGKKNRHTEQEFLRRRRRKSRRSAMAFPAQ
jgi:hypothetical protein